MKIITFNFNADYEYVAAFDYDGVVTKRGSSKDNEEKWLKREENYIWRKLMSLISVIYNRIVSYNKEIIEVANNLRNKKCKIIIITSHILTTSDYKESSAARNRIISTLNRRNVPFDAVIFVKGDKVEVCLENNVILMVDDNVDKVKKQKNAGINAIPKITKQNKKTLKNNPLAIKTLTPIIQMVNEILQEKEKCAKIKLQDKEQKKEESIDLELALTQQRIPNPNTFSSPIPSLPRSLILRKKLKGEKNEKNETKRS